MQFAYWAILIAACQPLLWAVLAKSGGGYDNHAPRRYLQGVKGWHERAQWAQQNSWEAFPLFAAAVLLAGLQQVPAAGMDAAAAVFVVLRFAYGFCYIRDLATLRSLSWFGAFLSVIWLFLLAGRVL